MEQNVTNQNGIFQLSVAYMEHRGLILVLYVWNHYLPLTPVATHRVGFKFTQIQIYYTKSQTKKSRIPNTDFDDFHICTYMPEIYI